jgi:hypothetical protein
MSKLYVFIIGVSAQQYSLSQTIPQQINYGTYEKQ